jgi:hypothetical protein
MVLPAEAMRKVVPMLYVLLGRGVALEIGDEEDTNQKAAQAGGLRGIVAGPDRSEAKNPPS